jgi:hypothetical protein
VKTSRTIGFKVEALRTGRWTAVSTVLAAASFALSAFFETAQAADTKPIVVFILADNVGYGDQAPGQNGLQVGRRRIATSHPSSPRRVPNKRRRQLARPHTEPSANRVSEHGSGTGESLLMTYVTGPAAPATKPGCPATGV